MSTFLNDLRYAIRSIGRQPLYAFMIVVLMALGVGGSTAVFRIFSGLFLKPLPFDRPEQLVDLDETAPEWDLEYVGIHYADFATWRERNVTFQAMGAFTTGSVNFSREGGDAERIDAVAATYDVPAVLGLGIALGRFFTPEEDIPDGPDVIVLTDQFWGRQFARDPGVLGRSVTINSRSREVIGVLAPEAELVADADVWMPLGEDREDADGWYLTGVGRMKQGVTLDQARADLLNVHRGMIEERPVNEATSPILQPVRDRYLGEYRLGSGVLLAAVGIVLLIACANIAGLKLARSLSRSREIGIRVAIGASPVHIVRQLLTESLTLAVFGGALGAALGYGGSSLLAARISDEFPPWISFTLDGRFVAFAVLLTVGAAVLFGLAPALKAARYDTRGLLSAAGTRTSASRSRRRSMSALVTGEVGLALLLLIVAGLSVQDLRKLQQIDPGFDSENLLSYRIALPEAKYDSAATQLAFFEEHLDRVSALPGVVAVAGANSLPLNGHWGWFFSVEGKPEPTEDDPNPVVLNRVVTPGYFQAMRVSLAAGRGFDRFDGREEGERVVVVNETFVRTFFENGEDPIGRRITPGGPERGMTIVGVTRDVKHYGVDEEMRPGVYQPMNQLPRGSLNIGVRTAGDPLELLGAIRSITHEADPELPLYDVSTMREMFDESLWTRRATSFLIVTFSSVALLLAVAGIYGVISYSVGQRFHEIGIRMALGARNGQVIQQVMRQGMLLVILGIVLGLGAAYATARIVAGLLVGVSPTDPGVFGAVTLFLIVVAALANFVPARRAARLEPMQVCEPNSRAARFPRFRLPSCLPSPRFPQRQFGLVLRACAGRIGPERRPKKRRYPMTSANKRSVTAFTTPSDREIVVTSTFAAPRTLLWEAWTSPQHLPSWMLGPAGWTMPVCEIDLRPGGTYRFGWRRMDGSEMEIRGEYREIEAPERLVYTESWGGDWPDLLNTLLLSEENGQTKTTVTLLCPSKQARDAVLETGMRDGVSLSYDRLDEYLQTIA